jgi:hypothetical protein
MQYVCGFMEDSLSGFLKAEGVYSVNAYLVVKQRHCKAKNFTSGLIVPGDLPDDKMRGNSQMV